MLQRFALKFILNTLSEVTPMSNSLEALFCNVDDFCKIFEQSGDS